ncbi:ComEA family DNA-binding protein [Isoptericola variabilis]|uniref:ComEA family DNA-binding protein n=1 Tax=Isoptericola variabilis TaxID=139208 RepID=UPI003D24C38A
MTTTLPPDHGDADAPPPDPLALADARPSDARPGGSEEGPDRALGEAAARLQAWRVLRADADAPPSAGRGPWDGREGGRLPEAWPAVDLAGGQDGAGRPTPDGEDELADRLRARRSARHVAAAYTAAHGHPVDGHDDGGGPRRWSIGLRAAVVASVAVLLVAVVVAVVATARPDDVITLAGASASSAASQASVGPSAAPSGASEPAGGTTAATGSFPEGAGGAGRPPGTSEAAPAPGTVVVHVVGEVREPGLVTVPAGARVADALAAAGGTTRRADAAGLNLARAVVDGEQIRVPRPGETVPAPGAVPDGADGSATGGAPGTSPGGAVSLNSATAADLEVLPGIGPALAGRIVAWREENGPFTSVDELDEVSGIGPSVLAQVRDLVTL